MQKDKDNQKISIPTIEGTKKQWQSIGQNYSLMDSCPSTFYYTISNLLKLDTAEKILQVACGAGLLIPMVIDLKNPNAQYYATDICEKMLALLKNRLSHHLQKYQSELTLEQWMEHNKLKVRLANGQESLAAQLPQQNQQSLQRFDRIIANMVLMLTPDPLKMLKNLFLHSKSGCLFGLSVWGNKQKNNVHIVFTQLSAQYGFPQAPKSRSTFHLYKKVGQLAKEAGWELVLNWEQNGMFPFLDAQQIRAYGQLCTTRMSYLNAEQQTQLENGFVNKMDQTLKSKRPLQFPAECYIFKKP